MPEQETLRSAREDQQQGKAPSTQAGEFVREEIEHVRRGKHGARSAQQAIAIGLSKARRAGVKLPPPNPGTMSTRTRRKQSSILAPRRSRTNRHGKDRVPLGLRSRARSAGQPLLAHSRNKRAVRRTAERRKIVQRRRGKPRVPESAANRRHGLRICGGRTAIRQTYCDGVRCE
jgi:Family of unknown function (DUF6496)